MVVAAEFRSAFGASVNVVFSVSVADTDFGFEVPVFSDHPGVSVCDTGTDEPTFITVLFEPGEIRAEEVGQAVDISDIVYTAPEVSGDEMASESFAGPVSHFGLDEPVFPFFVVGECPRVPVSRYVESPFWGDTDFDAEVHGGCSVVGQVCFDGPFLRMGCRDRYGRGEYSQQ